MAWEDMEPQRDQPAHSQWKPPAVLRFPPRQQQILERFAPVARAASATVP